MPQGNKGISFFLNLPPRMAIEYISQKTNQPSNYWWEVWQQDHRQVFTVAKAMKADILQDLRDAVDSSIAEGKTFRQFKDDIAPTLQKKGWWGKRYVKNQVGEWVVERLGSPHRLQNIYRTNTSVAYNTGIYKAAMDSPNAKYLRYNAVLDESTRDDHRRLDGFVAAKDDPIWNTIFRPNGYGCRCWVTPLSPEQAITYLENQKNFEKVETDVTLGTGEVVQTGELR